MKSEQVPPSVPDPTAAKPAAAQKVQRQLTSKSQNQKLQRLQLDNDDLKQRNEALADAVVNSVAIIEELEETKLQLAQAQAATEKASQDSEQMAKTIFEGTSDALLVLKSDFSLLSANRNAREIFCLEDMDQSAPLREQLCQMFHSSEHVDWFRVLISHSNSQSQNRLEIFRRHGVSETSGYGKEWVEVSISALNDEGNGIRYLLTARDITQRKSIEAQFQHQAFHDNVTGLPNRRYFIKQIEQLIEQEFQGGFAVCLLDLDNFKLVNDTLGHEAGDLLLVEVARRIQNTIRDDAFLARFGGDEFAILLPGMPAKTVSAIGNRVIKELGKPFQIHENSVYVGASIGMTRFPHDTGDMKELLQNADVAMYSAKESGRNRFRPFTPELAASVHEKQLLSDDLRAAIEAREIFMAFQPKWCIKSNEVVGYEALLRWERNGQNVTPDVVVEVAECTGLILPLGYMILETAISHVSVLHHKHSFNGTVAINLSPRQLVDPNFTKRFKELLKQYNMAPEFIELEITETVMVDNFELAFDRLRQLKELGVSLAIDDFGTGYSSLSYLKSFPISTLKLDRSFVNDLPQDPKAIAVAESVVSLGHGLGLTVVAEGVETKDQYDFFARTGCDQIQGFILSHARSEPEFTRWLLNNAQNTDFLRGDNALGDRSEERNG